MQVLLNLLAGVALLVWGTNIVRASILRLYGGDLRRVLRQSVSSRFAAFAAGLGVTALIQSSTATALIVAAFVGQGLIATAPALAVMLGADVGTSLMVLVFSFDLSWLSPLLIFTGVLLYLTRENAKAGRFGHILIGLGLIIMALQLIVLAAKPLTQAAGVQVIFGSLTGDVMLDMLVGATFSILAYSSLAVVLLTATLAASKVIGIHVAMALVLGANLGSGVLAMLNTLRSAPEARRVTLGNFLFKLIGCLAIAPLLGYVEPLLATLDPVENRMVVHFHLLFNVTIAVAFLFFTEKIALVAERLMPAKPDTDDPAKPRYLDPSALTTPALAIGCAAREALRIGDVIEQMLTVPLPSGCAIWTISSTTCTRRSSFTSRRSAVERWRKGKAAAGPTSCRSPSTWSRSATSSSGSSPIWKKRRSRKDAIFPPPACRRSATCMDAWSPTSVWA
jgi:phosphate:Na+ symporter